jgi:ribosomal RNA-processing protein 12
MCAVAAQNNLKHAADSAHQAKRHKGRAEENHEPAILHALQLSKTIATATGGWPSKKIEPLCELLLALSKSRNDYLVTSAFEVFEVIFDGMEDEVASSKLPRLLEAIVDLKPAQTDSQLLPPWIAIISRGYGTSAQVEPEDTFAKLPELFDLVVVYLSSPTKNIRVSASECLISFFANCIPDSVVTDPSVYDEKILEMLAARALGLLSVKYQLAWTEVFSALAALFDALRWRGDPVLLGIVKTIGELRSNSGFQGKDEADEVLGRAIRNLGPAAVLSVLPHNLITPQKGQPGRAWLLPLLRDHVSNTNLNHFKSDLVPLSEAMFQRVLNHGSAEKTMDVKIFETVVQQVWATLPGYCDLPLDLKSSIDQSFMEMVANLLYQQADLRVDLCRGLQNLVESNQALLASDLDNEVLLLERRLSKTDAQANLDHLASFASNMLAVLFNVYSQTLPQSRAYILQCIDAYLSVTPEADLIATFERVAKMLESELPSADGPAPKKLPLQPAGNKKPPTSHTLLDLIIALSVHLPRSTFGPLFALASTILTSSPLQKSDPQLIKKAYKLIPRLSSSTLGSAALKERNGDLRQLILITADTTPVPARRDRLMAINTLIAYLPSSELHFIPTIVSEVILACKEANERTRTAGFEVLLDLAARVVEEGEKGTMIRHSLVPSIPDDAPDVPASIQEVFAMVSAGLAGVAPHVIAASVTALSRLLWEYHTNLEASLRDDILDTVLMFLESNNREIVRAVLGFVKVAVVVLPKPTLEAKGRLQGVLKGCMIWSKENKGRLRQKVRGILERVLRRWDATQIENWVDDDEGRKMVKNVRKRKERAKRKKTANGADEGDEDLPAKKYDNEYDEAVYGSDDSDSEGLGSDDDEDMGGVSSKAKTTRRDRDTHGSGQAYIRADDDDDEPLDLLDPKSLGSITSRKLGRLREEALAGGKRRTKAKTNEDGKLVFGDDRDDGMQLDAEAEGGGVDAYVAAVDGPDAIRRGQKGRLKVKSAQRAGRGDDEMALDEEEVRNVGSALRKHRRAGSASSTGSGGGGIKKKGGDPRSARRGLGVEKQRGQGGGGGGRGRGGRKVSFSRHGRR